MSVGSMLVEARTAAGMSVADVSAATKIRPAVLQAIEDDDFTMCGGDAYAKGQLRSIARAIGLDPEVVLAAFDGRPPPGAVEVPPPPSPRRGRRRAEPSRRPDGSKPLDATRRFDRSRPRVPEQLTVSATPEPSGPDGSAGLARLSAPAPGGRSFNWTAAMLVAVVALLVVGIASVVTRGSSGGVDDVLAAPSQTSPAPTGPSAPVSTPSPVLTDDTVAQASVIEVTVDVTGDRSWLSVTQGKARRSLYEGLVETGDTQTFTSEKKIRMVVGNAGAVTISVNGQDLGSPGSIGEVATLVFDPDDPPLA